jgi:hypothetical protein
MIAKVFDAPLIYPPIYAIMLLRLGGAENRKYQHWLLHEVLAATHGDLYANHSLRESGEYLQSCKERGNIG